MHLLLPQPQGTHLHSSLSRTVLVKMQVGFDPLPFVRSAYWALCSQHLKHACCNPYQLCKREGTTSLPSTAQSMSAIRLLLLCQRHMSHVAHDLVQDAGHGHSNAAVCKGLPQDTQTVGL